jgi:sterol desaturase/sphingolipid hydroxylase (fatty acid hydroxylase superfamily)
MDEIQESIFILWTTPIIGLAIAAELILTNISGKKAYSLKGLIENFYLTSLNIILDLTCRSMALVVLGFFYQYHLLEWSAGLIYWLCLLLAEDFVYYWLHRFDHQCRLFWAIHVTHHSSIEFNITVGFRSSVLQPLYRFIYFIPLALLGFRITDIFLMYSLTQLYGIFIHTSAINKLGVLEYVLVTPSHHRVHHGSNVEYLDRNLGMVFIFWDRIFGSFTPESKPVTYGLTKNIAQRNGISLVLHEWKAMVQDFNQASTLQQKLKYIFGPPGWSHDGRSLTSKEMRKKLKIDDPRLLITAESHPGRHSNSPSVMESNLPDNDAL